MDKLVPLGKIVKPHGAEGFLKIQPLSDIDLNHKFIFIEVEGAPVPFFVIQHQVDGCPCGTNSAIAQSKHETPHCGKQ